MENKQRDEYLNSFNSVEFIDSSTVYIEKKYILRSKGEHPAKLYTLSNDNRYWKSDIAFQLNFDEAQLDRIEDDTTYNVRYLTFSLYVQERFLGRLAIRFGYDNGHETSDEFIKFLGASKAGVAIKKFSNNPND